MLLVREMNPSKNNRGIPLHFAAIVRHFKIWINKTYRFSLWKNNCQCSVGAGVYFWLLVQCSGADFSWSFCQKVKRYSPFLIAPLALNNPRNHFVVIVNLLSAVCSNFGVFCYLMIYKKPRQDWQSGHVWTCL